MPIGEQVRLIDGGHRVCKALFLGVDALPAYFLTHEESEASLIARTPALPGVAGQPVAWQELAFTTWEEPACTLEWHRKRQRP